MTGLALGLGLVVVWAGIPILLVVAGAWWLFGAFERIETQYLLGAEVGPAPRAWETADGVWGKLKAHFGSAATWRDLVYLLAKLPFGIASFTLLVTVGAVVAWLAAFPVAWYWHVRLISWGSDGGWTPPGWLAILAVPGALLAFPGAAPHQRLGLESARPLGRSPVERARGAGAGAGAGGRAGSARVDRAPARASPQQAPEPAPGDGPSGAAPPGEAASLRSAAADPSRPTDDPTESTRVVAEVTP